MGRLARRRSLVIAVTHLLASLAIAALYRKLGQPIGIVGLLPVLVGAFSFGLRGALASACVQAALNAFVMQYVLSPPEAFTVSSLVGIISYFALGAAVGNQRDLSRRVREELLVNERLRIREQETLAAIPDAMIRVAPDGTCRLQGLNTSDPLEQVIERVLGRVILAERHATIKQSIERVRATSREHGLTFESPEGSSHDMRFLPAADGSVLIVMRDVTEQRKLLRRATAAENLASMGTLAAGLAHEINNPLTYVITSVSAADQSLPSTEASAKSELNAAIEGCWRIRDIVRSILQTSTNQQDLVEPVHVPEVIDSALTLVQSQVRHHASIIWHPEEAIYALAHRTKLVQVVVNLVVNASQSFNDSHTSAHEIRIRAYLEAERVVIEVRDNGPGMTDAVKERVLEPFFTTKEPGRGSGLGLFLCNSIVESLRGTLQIESSAGRGTTVTIRLPFTDEPPKSRVTCRNAPLHSDPPSCLRVLVIDDEPEIRRALRRVLGHLCTVSICANGAEAWQHFVRGEKYDVILCDLLMPEMNGMELFGALVQEYTDQAERMLFLTGGATSDASRTFLQKHAARVVNKPFNPKEVEAVVRTTARFPVPIAITSMIPVAGS